MKMEFKSRTTELQENQESRTGSWKWCQDRYQNQITQQQQQKKERVLIDLPRICKFYNKKWQVQRKRGSGYVCVYTYVLIIVLNKILRQKWWAFNFCDFLSNSFVLFNFNFSTNSLSLSLSLWLSGRTFVYTWSLPTSRKFYHIYEKFYGNLVDYITYLSFD